MREFFGVGNACDDLKPAPHLGGPVPYMTVTISRLDDAPVHAILKAPPDHRYLDKLGSLGVSVACLPNIGPEIESGLVSFSNFYDVHQNRHQIVSGRQNNISKQDLPNFPPIPKDSVIFVAPVMSEVDPSIYTDLASRGELVVAPQGYFRQIAEDGKIVRRPWFDIGWLRLANIVILSDEDLTFNGRMDEDYLERLKTIAPKVILTRGAIGMSIYERDKGPVEVRAMNLQPSEVISTTGAGDSCTAALTWHYFKFGDLHKAAAFGALYSALKIMGVGGSQHGVEALPTIAQVNKFIADNPRRINKFLAANHLSDLSLGLKQVQHG